MTTVRTDLKIDETPIVRMENDLLRVDLAPAVGGKVVSITAKDSQHQFLWRNSRLKLEKQPPGGEYDPNFYGGIDELLPNDIPETVNGLALPDHGELWTEALESHVEGESFVMRGIMPISGLFYERRVSLRSDKPEMVADYRIENRSSDRRTFLWKLHAALDIAEGDEIDCPAATGQVVDLQWSRRKTIEPFDWPNISGDDASVIPANDGTLDFFYIYNLKEGKVSWRRRSKKIEFAYHFDLKVFPYVWYFASYGGFDGHYTAVLEPCSTMPISLAEAAESGQCSVLSAGETLTTQVTVYAGPIR